jgi:glycosyltransferase involved in cell wall biosynthesis
VRVVLDVSAVPDRPVGAGVYTTELARALTGRPDLVLVLVARTDDAHRWAEIAPGAEVHAIAPRSRPARVAWEQVGGDRVAARLRADVWHGPHYTMPARLHAPAVVTIHDLTFFDTPETHERVKVAWFRRATRNSARRAARLVCVSNHTAARLDAIVPDHAPVSVAHHGVDHDRFHVGAGATERDSELAVLAEHGIVPPYIAFVGTVEPRKNLPALVAAFALVAPAHPDLRLVLAGGDGWGITELRAAIGAHRVATRVVRPGYLPDAVIGALYRHAAVVAYPSLAEGFGLPALEAIACGAPLVTALGSAMDEVVDDAAIRVDPHQQAAIADGLRAALEPATAARLRAAGPLVAADYTWERCAQQHIDAYRLATAGVLT